ncbi:MAG: hypothetical protein ACD_73C00357G0001 [uncultured bacterium]|nr:MAG: hypothetical protein ACD_73C00357G0001 [uncultured bacterium]
MKKNPAINIWESKAKKVYQDGLKLFKDGMQGLEVMAGKTLEVGKIKLSNQQAVNRLKNLFSDLGHRVYDVVAQASQNSPIRITPDIQNFIEQIKKLQNYVDHNIRKLKHLTTVEGTQKAMSVKSRAAKATHKTGSRSKPKSKKKTK